ncbi:MAG: OsmC family protein [Halioglobus sp.]|nr:OsmC family protein [Halioglobus sp.]
MQEFPHHYHVTAATDPDENVIIRAQDMPEIVSAPPVEFGGPGNHWSPEHLLTASVADCFVLTFRAVAQASKLEWTELDVSAEGTLDRVDRLTKFTAFTVSARLRVPEGTDPAKATRVLEKAEAACLITNSLSAEAHLETDVVVG